MTANDSQDDRPGAAPFDDPNINAAPPLPFGVDDEQFKNILIAISKLPTNERAGALWALLTPEILEDFKKFAHHYAHNAPTTSTSVIQELYLKLCAMLADAGLDPVEKWSRVGGFVGYCHAIMRSYVFKPRPTPTPLVDKDGGASDVVDDAQVDPPNVAAIKDLANFADEWMKEHLPDYQRVIFLARAIDGLTFSEIERLPDLADYEYNEDQVRYQYRRARERIAAALDGR